jgi:hypothetical protein
MRFEARPDGLVALCGPTEVDGLAQAVAIKPSNLFTLRAREMLISNRNEKAQIIEIAYRS